MLEGKRHILQVLLMSCPRCNATTRWYLDGNFYTCQGDSKHPERRLYGCGKQFLVTDSHIQELIRGEA